MKTLLIVSGGTEAVPGIERAKAMGLHVVVSDGNPQAPGFQRADAGIVASTYDVAATIAAAEQYQRSKRPIDGVMCIAADVPLTVASVAAALGLPGLSIETAQLASDKLRMKDRLAAAGVPVPWYRAVGSVAALAALAEERDFRLVLKPVDSRGARGVLRLSRGTDLEWAYAHSARVSPTGRVMVEEYLEGEQISTESVLQPHGAATPGFSDRNYEYLERFAPFFIENGGHQPSVLNAVAQQAVASLAEKAGRALGVTTGIVKGDLVVDHGVPKVIEIATRLSGGWFSTDQIPLATGVDLLGAAIRLALGESVPIVEVTPRTHRGVAIRYFFPRPGRVRAITGAEAFAFEPWLHRLGFFVHEGDVVESATDHTKRAGFVITTGDLREQAIARAERVVNTIRIETVAA